MGVEPPGQHAGGADHRIVDRVDHVAPVAGGDSNGSGVRVVIEVGGGQSGDGPLGQAGELGQAEEGAVALPEQARR